MRERILREFFDGACDAATLRADLVGSIVGNGDVRQHRIQDMDVEFQIYTGHLIRLCDVVISGGLEPHSLQAIAFCVIASDNFSYDADTEDGNLVSEALFRWDSPEINFPLTIANVQRFKMRLLGGEDTLSNAPYV